MKKFIVWVYTADAEGSGTNASCSVSFMGSLGSNGPTPVGGPWRAWCWWLLSEPSPPKPSTGRRPLPRLLLAETPKLGRPPGPFRPLPLRELGSIGSTCTLIEALHVVLEMKGPFYTDSRILRVQLCDSYCMFPIN